MSNEIPWVKHFKLGPVELGLFWVGGAPSLIVKVRGYGIRIMRHDADLNRPLLSERYWRQIGGLRPWHLGAWCVLRVVPNAVRKQRQERFANR